MLKYSHAQRARRSRIRSKIRFCGAAGAAGTASVFINYVDRGNLATAAPLIQDELHLTATQLGHLFSAFYLGYVICMPGMGWLAERYGAKRVLAAGVAVWSIATFSTGFAGSFATLLGLRVMLGVGESVAFPCASKLLAQAVDVSRLGVANGVLSFGYLLGPAVGTLLGGYLMMLFGWRPVFLVFGALSLLWLWPWRRVLIGAPAAARAEEPAQPSFAQILGRRALWGASLGHFASNYTYYFIISWLPFYLVKSRGFSMGSMVAIASWAYLLNALSALAMGWAADRWIRAGHSPTLIYKSIMAANHIAAIGCMAGMVMLPAAGSIAALFVFEVVSGCSYPGLFAIPQILAGPARRGAGSGSRTPPATSPALSRRWRPGCWSTKRAFRRGIRARRGGERFRPHRLGVPFAEDRAAPTSAAPAGSQRAERRLRMNS